MRTGRPRPSARVLTIEIGLMLALGGWFLGAWLVVQAPLSSLPPGTRAFQLAIYHTADSLGIALALGLLAVAALAMWRARPLVMFTVVSALVLVLHWRYPILVETQPATTVLIAVASAMACVQTRRMWPVAVAALAVSALAMVPMLGVYQSVEASSIASLQPILSFLTTLSQGMVITGIGLGAAALLRRSRALAARLEETNTQLRAQREAVAQAAVVDERLRIARELHDVVAHHVTAMTVHAGAVRTIVATNPEAVGAPLQQIERSGRDAVAELHRMLGFLRGGEAADRAPAPGIEEITSLTASFPSLRVATEVLGDPDALSPMLGLSIYRIVQEALTNVVKHSTARSAVVRIEIAEPVLVTVRDPGRPHHLGTGTGHGTLGLRERATLHGGSLEVGPIPGGGWQVAAQLALHGSAS